MWDCRSTWFQEFQDDVDYDFLIAGVTQGFDVLEGKDPDFKCFCKNYKSTRTNLKLTEKQISLEIENGNFIVIYAFGVEVYFTRMWDFTWRFSDSVKN